MPAAVYSLHKTSTRAHIEKHALGTLRAARAEVLAELRYELPRHGQDNSHALYYVLRNALCLLEAHWSAFLL